MPEGTSEAAILIATSYQALNRALSGRKDTLVADAAVLILFAGFYVEATLNYIVNETGNKATMKKLLSRRYPGLQDKLAWFYNEFIARKKANTRGTLYKAGIEAKLRRRYPGYAELYKFRNDLSHGRVNRCAASLATAKRLRQNAKDLVTDLYAVVSTAGYTIPRITTYRQAVASFGNIRPSVRCR